MTYITCRFCGRPPTPEPLNTNRPRVIVTVSGGVADILENDGADVDIWDYDNCEGCNPDQTNPYESDYCPDYCTDQRGM